MLLAHEHQHNETMLQLFQMVESYEPVERDDGPGGEPASDGPEMVPVEGGEVEIGAGPEGFAYDNERPRHTIALAPFSIDRAPVTNASFAEFIADADADPPMYWEPDGEAAGRAPPWVGPRPSTGPAGDPRVVAPGRRVRALGGKAPTDRAEWEAAARGADPDRANLDQLAFGCAPAGAYADAPSECGATQMLGDVWEWTSSDFLAYPGFQPFPYPEYSEVFFGDEYKVLRGGAWATRRSVIRPSFRNWDYAKRSQIFAGFRCAKDD